MLYCSGYITDSRCVHGGQHGATVYQVFAGGAEEQQARAGCPADQTARDEPHDGSTSMYILYNATFIPLYSCMFCFQMIISTKLIGIHYCRKIWY